jgi:hypothetical protein
MKNKIILIIFILSSISSFAQSLCGGTNGSGTEFDPYTIYTKAHVDELTDSVNNSPPGTNNWSKDKYFILMQDITDTIRKPIGIGFRTSNPLVGYSFQGNFDGNNHKITLAINNYKAVINGDTIPQMFYGLFSTTYNAKISNLTVDGYIISDLYNIQIWYSCGVGGIVGYTFNEIEISNCTSYVNITSGYLWVGGIVGLVDCPYGTIENCVNYGNIEKTAESQGSVGGIVAQISNLECNILNCTNFGKIIGVFSNSIGGIAGFCAGTISDCINYGDIEGTGDVGGIAGDNGSLLYNCINVGNVICTGDNAFYISSVGGIVGIVGISNSATITNCINIGDIEGIGNVGGLVGILSIYNNTSPTITNCINAGYVKGTSQVGGILGIMTNIVNITKCVNVGVVEGNVDVGGVVGK